MTIFSVGIPFIQSGHDHPLVVMTSFFARAHHFFANAPLGNLWESLGGIFARTLWRAPGGAFGKTLRKPLGEPLRKPLGQTLGKTIGRAPARALVRVPA